MTSVTLIGKQFNYGVIGTGEPVVHIHGLEPSFDGTSKNAQRTGIPRLVEYLKNRFQVITYNNYGSGVEYATKAQASNDVDNIANECFVLLQHLNISKVHVFAHRQVGYPAIKLALDHPDLVQSVGLLDFEIVQSFFLNPKTQQAMARSMQRASMNPQYQQRMEMLRQMAEAAKSGTMPDGEAVDPEVAAQINSISNEFLEQFTPGTDQSDILSIQIRTWTTRMLSTSYEEVAMQLKHPIFAAIWGDGDDWARQSADMLKNWLSQTETYT
ncbi:MAG TPA: alpha/beta hydrolase, partial [Nitrososphaerales archaeon]|nr:alpha/beta hydrolase [Nitrososphaerales archaeon]